MAKMVDGGSGKAEEPQTEPQAEAPKMSVAELAKRYALPVSEEAITALEATGQDLTEWAREQASGMYPTLAKQIQAGVEPHLLLSPYLSLARRELEREVELDDPIVQDFFVGNEQPTLNGFSQWVRSTPEWDATEGAQRHAERFIRRISEGI